MMRVKPLLFVVSALVLIAAGFLVFRGARPEIVLTPEPLFHIGGIIITNTVITGTLVMVVLAILLISATRTMALVPSGLQNLVEALVEWSLELVEGIAGPENGRRFFPLVF